MSSSGETVFGQDKTTVIVVASIIIFVLSVVMLGVFINQGVSSGWSGTTVLATVFSSMIALIFVSVATYYGFVKGKEVATSAIKDLSDLRAKDKLRDANLAKAIEDARKKVQSDELATRKKIEEDKKAAAIKIAEEEAKKKFIEARVRAELEKETATKALAVAENAKIVAEAAKQKAATDVIKAAASQQQVAALQETKK